MGQFEQARAIIDPAWLLFLPSVMCFAVYDVYINTTEYNRPFEKEQAAFLKKKYQNATFKMPTEVGAEVYVTASFEHAIVLELAISELEQKRIPREQVCAIPLNAPRKERQLFDTIHWADGLSMFDLATILGMIFMLFGIMWGFRWTWGPVIGGTLGLIAGAALGFGIKYFYYRLYAEKQPARGKNTEVMLIVSCQRAEAEMVEQVLAGHLALSVGRKE